MKRNIFVSLAILVAIILFCLPSNVSADENVYGSTAGKTTFYVTTDGSNAQIKLTSVKGLAHCSQYKALVAYVGDYDEENHGFYNVKVEGLNRKSFVWTPSATKQASEDQVFNETLTINFPFKGEYTVTVDPISPSSIQHKYWKEDQLNNWIRNATWSVTSTSNCSVSFKQPVRYTSDEVTINYYFDGVFSYEETRTVSSNTFISPKAISGYTCSSSSVYITFDSSVGCDPRQISFFYKSDEPAEVYIWVNCYDDHDNYLKSYKEIFTESRTIYPVSIDGYHTVSDPVYISYNNGTCTPSYAHFYYVKDRNESESAETPSNNTSISESGASNQYKPPAPESGASNQYYPPASESAAGSKSEYRSHRDVLDVMEKMVIEDSWSLSDIKASFERIYGGAEGVQALEPYTNHSIFDGYANLGYYYSDWYCTYTVYYFSEDQSNLAFSLEYTRVYDPSNCDTNMPTYSNWYSIEPTSCIMSSSGNEYYFYGGNINEYVSTQYYDSTTVMKFIVWDSWDLYI